MAAISASEHRAASSMMARRTLARPRMVSPSLSPGRASKRLPFANSIRRAASPTRGAASLMRLCVVRARNTNSSDRRCAGDAIRIRLSGSVEATDRDLMTLASVFPCCRGISMAVCGASERTNAACQSSNSISASRASKAGSSARAMSCAISMAVGPGRVPVGAWPG